MKLKIKLIKRAALLTLLTTVNSQFSTARAQGTAFTYQGRLNDNGVAANGSYDLRFAVFDAVTGGNQAGVARTNLATGVTNGVFAVTLDFGGIFTGASYWLDIGVRTNGAGTFVGLTPRQPLLPVPYAMFANTAGNLSGTVSNSALPASPSFSGTVSGGSFSGSGANLTSINAGNISSGTLADARLSGNVALRAGGNTFTETQVFDGQIRLDTTNGFSQSSSGNFYIDAPFLVGGRVAVLENGNVGVGVTSPIQKLQVAGTATVTGSVGIGTTNPTQKLHVVGNALLTGALDLPATATINGGPNRIFLSDPSLQNVFIGQVSGIGNTTGGNNTAVGNQALPNNTTGTFNTAIGNLALDSNTTASFNTATGALALFSNTTGSQNTAGGFEALFNNTTGINNTAIGFEALASGTFASNNTAMGALALNGNTTGANNVAVGDSALAMSSGGNGNTAVGHQALQFTTGTGGNTAIGMGALVNDTTGPDNVAIGNGALGNITTGSGNIGIGIGSGAQLSSSANNNIDIGDSGSFTDQGTIRIGDVIHHDAFIAGVFGSTAASGVGVFVDSNGHLGTFTSSARFKQNIRSMGDESDVLLSLRPVSFQYKPEYDPQGLPQFGLIAEEVEKVDPDLVAHDADHHIYTVRYQAVDAMLLNEFLKQHQKLEAQKSEIQDLKQSVADLKALTEKSARN